MKALLLRFDAPLMAFGDVAVDHHRQTDELPGLAMLTGLLGAALGYQRFDTDRLQDLQDRLSFSARVDRQGEPLRDYQTVDLGQPSLDGSEARGIGWTTRGRMETRGGAEAATGTHIRLRHFWADRVVTVALALRRPDAAPRLEELAEALIRPSFPLYIGRKSCPPAASILLEVRETPNLRTALVTEPRAERADTGNLLAEWPPGEAEGEEIARWDRRDWRNQVHAGSRSAVRGLIDPPGRSGNAL